MILVVPRRRFARKPRKKLWRKVQPRQRQKYWRRWGQSVNVWRWRPNTWDRDQAPLVTVGLGWMICVGGHFHPWILNLNGCFHTMFWFLIFEIGCDEVVRASIFRNSARTFISKQETWRQKYWSHSHTSNIIREGNGAVARCCHRNKSWSEGFKA